MKRFRHAVAALPLAILSSGCTEMSDIVPCAGAIEFSTSGNTAAGSRAEAVSPAVFVKGDGIGVFACYRPQPDTGQETPFVDNFMKNQLVSFDGEAWTYSPVKYWPTDGTVEFYGYFPYNPAQGSVNGTLHHECRTGLEYLYGAHSTVKAEHGTLSGDGMGADGRLQLRFTPMLNKVNFTASAEDKLFDEDGEFRDCSFLIREFRVWGFYREALCNTADGSWSGHSTPYVAGNPLDMTESLDRKPTEEEFPGYVYDPGKGYCTDKAVAVHEGERNLNIFGRPAHFIPMDGIIAGNDPGFEIVYVVLTNREGGRDYRESGIVTRTGSLRDIFENRAGLIKKVINVNLTFTADGVTVTCDLSDYKYKPMF